jgi:hypothetical protein
MEAWMRFYGPLFRSIAIGVALVLAPLAASAQTVMTWSSGSRSSPGATAK